MEDEVYVGSFSVVVGYADAGGFVEFSLDCWGRGGHRVF